MHVVLDTNVLLSACWKPDGNEALVVRRGLEGRFRICVSADVLAEYRDVLFRPKFIAYHESARLLVAKVEAAAENFKPSVRLAIAKDPDDDRLLECAEAARAAYIVTGNLRDFPAQHKGTRILNARAFLKEAIEEPLLD